MEAHKIDIEKLIMRSREPTTTLDYEEDGIERMGYEKKMLGGTSNELHKKLKNIRDNFSRDIHQRKGKSGAGAYRKAPYVYTQRLQFLTDVVLPRQTTSSLDNEYSFELDTNNPEMPTLIYKEKYNSKIGK
ncbi:unnamed protein product [Acanthoscelides obtectus]|uniref:Uncharacterized protein n=1 Tax=Acanthoscelides obtectus TaxID=200917 RepID=A0A9P0PVQ1_ACAOB|nr:unnamed protein product [Acanthoscelides obtectus]CAK1633661.1 hypothetical protein AOBTE_LOCUS8298 [Acanthoscelides obtectus]